MSSENELPLWPSKGNRRRLEEQWLARLERDGLSTYLVGEPDEAPPALAAAIDEFNAGLFWECHETLEDVWLQTPYPLRFFYHAIIKAAVGLHHMSRHNRHGTRVKLADSERLLHIFPSEYIGVQMGALLKDISRWLALVDETDQPDWARLDRLARPNIKTGRLG